MNGLFKSNFIESVVSPISGYVKNLLVKEGDYVSVGQPLVSVTQNRKLFLRADVSEKYYPYLNSIGSANFCTPYNNKVYTLKELGGRMLSYGKASGENGYYVPVTFEFDNKGDVIPGSFVEVFLLSSPMENVLSLPHSALTEEQGSFFVYLQLDEEGYKKQLVTLGADNGESVQILSGIKASKGNAYVAGILARAMQTAPNIKSIQEALNILEKTDDPLEEIDLEYVGKLQTDEVGQIILEKVHRRLLEFGCTSSLDEISRYPFLSQITGVNFFNFYDFISGIYRELKITKLEYHTIKVGDVCTLYNLVEHLRRNVCYEEKECCFGADTKV